jgi:putative ABC transport system permease protein
LLGNSIKGISSETAAHELENSGLFKNIAVIHTDQLITADEENSCVVEYVNREAYSQIFGDDPPVSYDELVSSGGYVVNSAWDSLLSYPVKNGTLNVFSERMIIPEDMKTEDWKVILSKAETEKISHTINVIGSFTPGYDNTSYTFYSASETYQTVCDEWFGTNLWGVAANFSYNSDEYNYSYNKKAEEWFDSHSDYIYLEENLYKDKCNIHCIMSSIKSGVMIFNVLMALAALINLLNIISTGIANRRSELASLQCIGMTDKQLYRMTVIECMQFTVTAALLSAALCAAIILGTEHLLPQLLLSTYSEESEATREMLNDLVRLDHTAPFIRIVLASVTAFAAGCITSFLMLRSQNRDSLSDQIRGTEIKLDIKRIPNR